jgi:GDP-L-fucose synthase
MPTEIYSLAGRRVWVAGANGMVGGALVRRLQREGCEVLPTGRAALDLRDRPAVDAWLAANRPDAAFVAAAVVGGIVANAARPVDFLHDNLLIACNAIAGAYEAGVGKLLFLGSSCIYPREATQPIRESELLSGPLEPTNQWYAIAKIAGLTLAKAYRAQHGADFISAMPTNLYGPGDNFDPEGSHVIPGLIRRAHMAKISRAEELVIWGSGAPRREFLHVDDCANGLVRLMTHYTGAEPVNVGCGEDLSILELATLVAEVVGFEGRIVGDPRRPDGTPRKLLNVDKLNQLGWRPRIGLREGLVETYRWFCAHEARLPASARLAESIA